MNESDLTDDLFAEAVRALNAAAADLHLREAATDDPVLLNDARVLVGAIERELLALHAIPMRGEGDAR